MITCSHEEEALSDTFSDEPATLLKPALLGVRQSSAIRQVTTF